MQRPEVTNCTTKENEKKKQQLLLQVTMFLGALPFLLKIDTYIYFRVICENSAIFLFIGSSTSRDPVPVE